MSAQAERSARIDAEIEALAREKERYKAEAAAVERERQLRSSNRVVDNRELPLVGMSVHMQHCSSRVLQANLSLTMNWTTSILFDDVHDIESSKGKSYRTK